MCIHARNAALIIIALCLFVTHPHVGQTAEKADPNLVKGWNLLQQKKYAEARAALEAGVLSNLGNADAHFYLAEACRGLKDWGCAEEHYDTSLELDDKSSVAAFAKQRSRKAKAWRLIDESNRIISDPHPSAEKLVKAKDALDIAKDLGLDDEQEAVFMQLQKKIDEKRPAQAKEMPMVLIPSGEFTMGEERWCCSNGMPNAPAHHVYLDAYYIDKFEVTTGMYASYLKSTIADPPPEWDAINQSEHKDRPVVKIDWSSAVKYCRWAGKRLPSEAEWEKAARGTDTRAYPWGIDSPTRLHANFGRESKDYPNVLLPVGSLEDGKSPYGIYDMAGNVYEWVNDWYEFYDKSSSPSKNPTGPLKGTHKVKRGGSWRIGNPDYLRSTHRMMSYPTDQERDVGFRCAKSS